MYTHPFLRQDWPSWIPDPHKTCFYSCELAQLSPYYATTGDARNHVKRIEGRCDALSFKIRRIGVVSVLASFHGLTVNELRAEIELHGPIIGGKNSRMVDYFSRLMLARRLVFGPADHTADRNQISDREATEFLKAFCCDFMLKSLAERFSEENPKDLDGLKPLLDPESQFDESDEPRSSLIHTYARTRELCFCRFEKLGSPNRNQASAQQPLSSFPMMGWVQQGVEIGDEVCVVHGWRLPMVLKRAGDVEYRFAGVCYVLGFMDGQAMADPGLKDEFITVV
jgi:hypothetical protein